MSIEMVEVLNSQTGERGSVPRRWFNSPVINKNGILVEVDARQKPYISELFKSRIETPETNEEEEAE